MSKTERNQYKIAGPATWELIRAAYLGGESARALAERFGVSEHAIRKRITVEKWSKRAYAAALEARGVVREKQKPNFIEEGVLREEMRLAAEALAAAKREAEMNALVEQIASEEDAAGIAAAIERRALAQASAAMVQGRSKEAQALASMADRMRRYGASSAAPRASDEALQLMEQAELQGASLEDLEQRALSRVGEALAQGKAADAKVLTGLADQLRKRIESQRAAEAAKAEAEQARADRIDVSVAEHFGRAATLACVMLHAPACAPHAFVLLVKRWREINLGEGEADAEARAQQTMRASQHFLDGSWVENLPEEVRLSLDYKWHDARERMQALIRSEGASASG